jgi:thymidine phosphorylase
MWLAVPDLALAPHELVIESPRAGRLSFVDTRQIGMLMVEAGAGRTRAGDDIDYRVSLSYQTRLGREIGQGQELARLYLRQPDQELRSRFAACFEVGDVGEIPPLVVDRVSAAES